MQPISNCPLVTEGTDILTKIEVSPHVLLPEASSDNLLAHQHNINTAGRGKEGKRATAKSHTKASEARTTILARLGASIVIFTLPRALEVENAATCLINALEKIAKDM
jgi:hypothetical protein